MRRLLLLALWCTAVLWAKSTMTGICPLLPCSHNVAVSRKEGISTGQVQVLNGLSGALTLSYYLTGPGDVHYAVLPHGYTALQAEEIKAAAISLQEPVVAAGTYASDVATRLGWNVVDLEANATYDVYFVAEASNSNGVFGTVRSVVSRLLTSSRLCRSMARPRTHARRT